MNTLKYTKVENNQIISIESYIDVMRVNQGWIYIFKNKNSEVVSTQFVPDHKPTGIFRMPVD
jgi:hypothetical protein